MNAEPKTAARRAVVKGERVVLLNENEYERLLQKADEWEPDLPEPDADGNYPAIETLRASLARKFIRHRRRLGLSQAELARRAGVRLGTLIRLEQGQHIPSNRTVDKVDHALTVAEAEKRERA